MNKLGLDHGQVVSEFAFYDPEDYNFLFKKLQDYVNKTAGADLLMHGFGKPRGIWVCE